MGEAMGSEIKELDNDETSMGNSSENDGNNLIKEATSNEDENDNPHCEISDYKTTQVEDAHKNKGEENTIEDAADNGPSNNKYKGDNLKEGILMDNVEGIDTSVMIDDIDDSSDESSDEDTTVEYMPDGEIVRKKSRGFKQLTNCKRFWKASLNVG